MGILRRLFGGERTETPAFVVTGVTLGGSEDDLREGRELSKEEEEAVRNAVIPEGFGERLVGESVVGRWCETIEATHGIPAETVWAEYSAHVDVYELGASVGAKLEEREVDRDGRRRAEIGDAAADEECLEIQRTELIANLEKHGGDPSLLRET